MVLNLFTQNLNQRVYERAIRNIVLHLRDRDVRRFMYDWEINVYDLRDTNPIYFKHFKTYDGQKINTNIPSGVTGLYEINLFLHDDMNPMKLRENLDRIQHEICHALLYEAYGTEDKIWVDKVHNNNRRFKIEFWYRHHWFWYTKIPISIIDVRSLLRK